MSRMKKIKSRGKGVGLRICMIVILLLTAGLLLTCNNPLKDLIAADIFESKASSFQLTISIAGEGTTTPSGTVQVRQYEAITIKADAMEGWEFEGWRLLEGENAIIEDNTSLETTITLTDSDASVQAKFFFLDTTQPETTIE